MTAGCAATFRGMSALRFSLGTCDEHRCVAGEHLGSHRCACSFTWGGDATAHPPPGKSTGRLRHRFRLRASGRVELVRSDPVAARVPDDGVRAGAGRGPTADELAAWAARSGRAGYRRARAGAVIFRWLRGD